jgi:tellurite resistance protein
MDKDPPHARLYYLFGASQHPHGTSWLERLPAGVFGISVGLFGLAGAWRRAASFGWEVATDAGELLLWIAGIVWAICTVLYACKCKRHPQAVLQESRHPVDGSLQALLPISAMLGIMLLNRPGQGLWLVLAVVALALNGYIGWRVISVLATGQLPRNAITPALYLPIAGGALVGSMALATLQYRSWGAMLFGIGVAGWAVLEARIMSQLFEGPIPEPVRTTIGIELAPPVIATLSAATVWPALPADILLIGLGIAVIPFATVFARYRWWTGMPFNLGFWSFSFPFAALASAVLEIVHRSGWPFWIGTFTLIATTAMIAWMSLRTIVLLVQGRLLSPN